MPVGDEPKYKFKVVPSGEEDYHYLVHEFSGKYICSGGTDNGTVVHLWGPIPDGHEDRYKFKFVRLENGQYYILHKFSGKYLSSERRNGTPVHLWGPIPDGDQTHYQFTFTRAN
jgi:hypothetical protein